MRKPVRDIGSSVRARLLSLAKKRNQPFDLLLTHFADECFLYRLTTLMTAWLDGPHRPGRDLDLARARQSAR